MKKDARLEIREDVRLKRMIDQLASRMGITSTDFLRMVIRNGARFYAKKLNVPYLIAYDIAYGVVENQLEKVATGGEAKIDEEEMKMLEDNMKKLK